MNILIPPTSDNFGQQNLNTDLDNNKVIQSIREQLLQNPNDGPAHYRLGFCYLNIGLIPEGVNEIKAAITFMPENTDIRYELANILMSNNGDLKEALDQLNIALKIQPNFMQALHLRGVIYEKLGQIHKGVNDWKRAYILDRNYSENLAKLEQFIEQNIRNVTPNILQNQNIDEVSRSYLTLFYNPIPPEPSPLGRTSLEILRIISEEKARKMNEMYAEKLQAYNKVVTDRTNKLENMELDIIAMSNICLLALNERQAFPGQNLSVLNNQSNNQVLPNERRREILEQEIGKYSRRGYRVQSQTDISVQLVKPQSTSDCFIYFFLIILTMSD